MKTRRRIIWLIKECPVPVLILVECKTSFAYSIPSQSWRVIRNAKAFVFLQSTNHKVFPFFLRPPASTRRPNAPAHLHLRVRVGGGLVSLVARLEEECMQVSGATKRAIRHGAEKTGNGNYLKKLGSSRGKCCINTL